MRHSPLAVALVVLCGCRPAPSPPAPPPRYTPSQFLATLDRPAIADERAERVRRILERPGLTLDWQIDKVAEEPHEAGMSRTYRLRFVYYAWVFEVPLTAAERGPILRGCRDSLEGRLKEHVATITARRETAGGYEIDYRVGPVAGAIEGRLGPADAVRAGLPSSPTEVIVRVDESLAVEP